MSIAQRLANLADGLDADGVLSAAKGGTGNTTGGGTTSPTVSQISYSGNDTAADPSGGTTITLSGTNFASGAKVLINNTQVSVVTVVSSTQITFTAPQLAAGSYILYVVNLDGSTAIAVPGIQYSGTPAWSTPTGSLGTGYETGAVSASLSATSDSAVTYSVFSGTLPTGATLNSNGTISGTSPLVSGSTTYTFTVRATDAENQDTDREFSLTVNPDVVSWSSPTNGATLSATPNTAYSSSLTATSAAGSSISYTADSLPAGLAISGSTITGTPTAAGTSTTTLTATAAATSKTAQITINWTINIAADAYWKYTTLLLNAETAAVPFLADASANNFALTVFGDTKPNNFNPYTPGYYSNYFDGTGDFLSATVPQIPIGSSQYTIELWIKTSSATKQTPVFWGTATNNQSNGLSILANGSVQNWWYANDLTTSGVNIIDGAWHHIVAQFDGTTRKIYVDGIQRASDTPTGKNTVGTSFYISSQNGAASEFNYVLGNISNLRISNTAVYSTAFTALTSPLIATANTVLLTCQSNRFVDNSANAYTITRNGDVKVSSFDPFVPSSSYSTYGSTYFNGSSYLSSTIPTTTIGTNDFTVECWVYPTAAYGSLSRMFLFGVPGAGYLTFFINSSGQIVYGPSGSDRITTSSTVPLNTWTHIAISRSNGTSNVYINGVSGGSATDPSNFSSANNFYLGQDGSGNYFTGYINDFRLVIGSAVYTTTFTPPTAPLTAVTNTQLLTLQTNQPNTNSVFLDNSSNALAISRTGNATQGSFSPYGANWSNYFDGNGDYLSIANNSVFNQNSPFTVECWVYATLGGYFYTQLNNGFMCLNYTVDTRQIKVDRSYVGVQITSTNSFAFHQWHHVAMSYDGTTTRLFVNGALEGSVAGGGAASGTDTQIGAYAGSNNFNGYISNFRVSNTALYTSAFTPSTQPLTPLATTRFLTCQAASIVDNSISQLAITKNGDVSVQRFSPFNPSSLTSTSYSWNLYTSGSYQVSRNATLSSLSTGAFTVEGWYYPTLSLSSRNARILSLGRDSVAAAGNTSWDLYISNGTALVWQRINTTAITYSANYTFNLNTWYHIVVCRDSSDNLALFVNGTRILLQANETTNYDFIAGSSSTHYIGASYNGTAWSYALGYYSNIRVIKGATAYDPTQSTITVPTTPLTVTAQTSMLLFGNNGSDLSGNYPLSSISRNDNQSKMVTFNPFGYTSATTNGYTPSTIGGSVYLDGSDGLGLPTTVYPKSTSWTLEAWVYTIPGTNAQTLINFYPHTTIGISLNRTGSGDTYVYIGNGSSWISAPTISSSTNYNNNAWNHVALVRDNTNLYLFLNGVKAGTTTTVPSGFTSSGTATIGQIVGGGEYLTGYVSDFRLTDGVALYTASFVPPQTPLTAVPNTTLLLNMDRAAIADKSGKTNLETVGDAKISTTITKFGGSSMAFNGSTSKVVTVSSPNMYMNGAFTIECWVYWTGTSTNYQNFVGSNDTFTSNASFFRVWGSGAGGTLGNKIGIGNPSHDGTSSVYSVNNLPVNTWTHVAATRDSSNIIRVFINGNLERTGSTDTSVYNFGQGGTCIGDSPWDGAQGWFSGYIDDLRITRGYARYTANFTPPTEALLTK